MINYAEIEKKWQKAWEEAKAYEPEPNDKEGILVNNAFPYVNAPLHVGHFRAYGTADSYARYLRLKGMNALFPFGFHATGTPITAFAKRIASGDKELIGELVDIYRIPREDVVRMTTPEFIADYMVKWQERILRVSGMGIDWRRKFITIEPLFSKMVEWQFMKLKEKGYLVQGEHAVSWCPTENHAVGDNDTQHDAHPKIEEVSGIKFKDTESDVYFLCSTYRPETIYAVTNLFVRDGGKYVIAEIKGSKYYIAKDAAEALTYQLKPAIIREVSSTDLLKKRAINPVTKEEVPVLPGFFVKENVGTGVVMSVPSHAPFDYAALERLRVKGYPLPKFELKKIIKIDQARDAMMGGTMEVEGAGKVLHPEIPALAYLELLNANPDAVDDLIERATKLIYKEESRWGIMLVGKYAGKKETEARDGLKADLAKSGDALPLYELANEEPVFCRDGTKVVVNVVTDQWFINYGDTNWKKGVMEKFDDTKVIPERLRQTFETAINWIDLRAAERAHGLGTKFPWNPSHIIESLSDSTIYMVFYTFVNLLRASDVKPEQLKPEFFDYVITSKGEISGVVGATGIDESTVKKCKEQFEYWYKHTSSHSATEHIFNHFVMYLYNHHAVLPEQYFPKQIAVNGMLLYEGEKMSKSLGNIVPLEDAIAKYGADATRFVAVSGSELDSVSDFTPSIVNGVLMKNEFLRDSLDKLNSMSGVELEHIDYWLYSKLNSKIKGATQNMDSVEFRSAYTEIYYNSVAELKYYFEKGGRNQIALRDFLNAITIMLAPLMPHFAEEMWHMMGNNTLVVQERWPTVDESMINKTVEAIEDAIASTADDINNAIALTSKIDANKGKRLKEVRIIVADDWKSNAYNLLLEKREIPKVLKEQQFEKVDKEKAAKFLGQFMSKLNTLQRLPDLPAEELYAGFSSSVDYLRKRLKVDMVIIEKESASQSPRAARAMPDKPSIDLHWG